MTREQWAAMVLGVPVTASKDEIAAAYRVLVQVWHPDRHGANERVRTRAEVEIKKINLANSILSGKDGEAEVPDEWMSGFEAASGDAKFQSQPKEESYYRPEPPPPQTRAQTYYEHTPVYRPERNHSGAGAFGGLVIGGLIGLFIGGWGAIPGAIIGACIGGAIGGSDRGAGEAVDEAGGCALGCIGETIGQILTCGCLILIVVVIIAIASSS